MNPLERILHLITTAIAEQQAVMADKPAEMTEREVYAVRVLRGLEQKMIGGES